MRTRTYGKYIVSDQGLPNSGDVGHILGSRLLYDHEGNPSHVELQYMSQNQEAHQLRMGFLDAMFLLSNLKAMQLDTGTPFPDDPRSQSTQS
ncbi:hypothetical protein [Albibacillus kandeliae]|uniref:hypothetical protein n=1 Tax=Albibacillus kandeliae TaxID=2174228 RepID=UPI0013004B46|nr:hypothetical protein [Albibacillus kandeliae]